MHIIIGFLGVVATLLFLLHRLAEAGIDLGGLNPFLWRRRRAWRKKYEGDQIYKMDRPMEVTALLMAAAARAEGDLSAEQTRAITDLFENEFRLSSRDATALLTSSLHLLGDGQEVGANVARVLAPSREAFTGEQAASCVELIETVAKIDGPINEQQREILRAASAALPSAQL